MNGTKREYLLNEDWERIKDKVENDELCTNTKNRKKFKPRAFHFEAFKNTNKKMGHIHIDDGNGGLAFNYVNFGEVNKTDRKTLVIWDIAFKRGKGKASN